MKRRYAEIIRIQWAALVACSLMLAACSSGPNVKPGYSLAKAAADGNGVLVLSLTTDNPDNAYVPELDFNYSSKPHDSKDSSTLKGMAGCDPNDPKASDFGDSCGRLFVVELAAGDYYVLPWSVTLFPPLRVCAPLVWEPVHFTIIAGKATYLGEFHLQLGERGQDRMGMMKFGAAWVTAGDAHARDFLILGQRYPGIGTDTIQSVPVAFPARDADNDPAGSNCGHG